jgi:type II secretion system protein C
MINKIRDLLNKLKRNKDQGTLTELDAPKSSYKLPKLRRIPLQHTLIKLTNFIKAHLNNKFLNKSPSEKTGHKKHKDWIESLNRIYSPEFQNYTHQAFVLLFFISAFYLLGKTSALFFAPTEPNTGNERITSLDLNFSKEVVPKDIEIIKTANLFKTTTEKVVPGASQTKVAKLICDEATKTSNLPINLINTIVLQDSVKSVASVQVRSEGILKEIREGEQIPGIAEIGKIKRLGMVIKNLSTGECENIFSANQDKPLRSPINVLSPSQSKDFKAAQKEITGIKNEGNKFKIAKSLINEKMKDINSILTQAKGIPITNPDGSLSFKLTEIEPGGLFAYLGVQDNDIITAINGKEIRDMNEVMNLFSKIQSLEKLQLTINRGGAETPLDYSFE